MTKTHNVPSHPAANPPQPILQGPVGGMLADGLATTFAWQPVAGSATHRLQVAADATFNEVLFDAPVGAADHLTLYDLFRPNGDTYFWRVEAEVGTGGVWSTPEAFRAVTTDEVVAMEAAMAPLKHVPAHLQKAEPEVALPPYLTGTSDKNELLFFMLFALLVAGVLGGVLYGAVLG